MSSASENAATGERMRRFLVETRMCRDCEYLAHRIGHELAIQASADYGREYRFRMRRHFEGDIMDDDALTWRVQVVFRRGDNTVESILPTGLTQAAIQDELEQLLDSLRRA